MRKWKPSWADIMKTIVHQAERQFRWARTVAKRTFGLSNPAKILPYRGYGTPTQIVLLGRVLEDRQLGSPKQDDHWWQNAKAMYGRFVVDEFPNVRVRAEFQGQTYETITDRYGYYSLDIPLAVPLNSHVAWHSVALELDEPNDFGRTEVRAECQVLVPTPESRFGVISDVDDTIIRSEATDFLRMARITFLNNATTRTPLPGVSRFYRALELGTNGQPANPFFYVSSSVWNLYDMMADFLDLHDIPAGPILMRDMRLDDHKLIKSGHEHKLEKITRILNTYDHLPFVLVGDAGQDDPMIYREVVHRCPDQVLAIYIRTVGREKRNQRVRDMVAQLTTEDVPMLLIEDIDQAFEHATALGLITTEVVHKDE
jgi:phosphatidate phosphatase APP1